jgi:hypothetical protein
MSTANFVWIKSAAAAAEAAAHAVGTEAAARGATRPCVIIVFSTDEYRRLAQLVGLEAVKQKCLPDLAIDIGSAAGHTTEVISSAQSGWHTRMGASILLFVCADSRKTARHRSRDGCGRELEVCATIPSSLPSSYI